MLTPFITMKFIKKTMLFTSLLILILPVNCYSQITVKAVGDIMLGSLTPKEIIPPDSGREFVESISENLKNANIVFGNLEGAFIQEGMQPQKCSDKSRDAGRCYEFGMPEKLSPALKELGFTVLNLDNNHSEDYSLEGYEFTQQKLNELGISFAPKQSIASLYIKDKKICMAAFGYSEKSFNISDLITTRNVIENIKKQYDIVIVSFHGGAEGKDAVLVKDTTEMFLGENRGNVFAFAHTAIEAGADLVIGHGPHVLRALEVYKNKLIAYSLGNFLTYGNINIAGITGVSIILKAELDETNGDFLRGKLIPVNQIDRGIPVYDKNKEGMTLIKELTENDFPKTKIYFANSGSIYNLNITPPLPRSMEPLFLKSSSKNINMRGVSNSFAPYKIKKPGD